MAASARAPCRIVAAAFRVDADDESGVVDEMHDREVEGVGEVDEASDLLRRVGCPPGAVEVRVAGQHRHRPAVDAGEPRHRRPAVPAADLEERVSVDDRVDDVTDLVDLPGVARDRVGEPVLTALGVVGWIDSGRRVVDRPGEVGEEGPGTSERVVFGVDHVVDGAVATVDLAAAELLLVDVLTEAGDHRWSRDEQL